MENKLKQVAFDGALSLCIAFGYQLDLFKTMADAGNAENPATIETFAAKAGLKENYAEMWLNCMAAGGIFETTTDGKGYYIAKENLPALTGDAAAGPIFCRMIPIFSEGFNETLKLAKSGTEKEEGEVNEKMPEVRKVEEHGPNHSHGGNDHHGHQGHHGHDHHGHVHGQHPDGHENHFPLMDQITQAIHRAHLIPDFLPLTEMKSKLEAGIEVLDVGCGTGFHVCEFASHFPNSKFIGIDISPGAIEKANEKAKSFNLKNVEFKAVSGEEMSADWAGKFDWVYSFVSIHDHEHPEKAVKEIKRVLKPNGRYTMLEINKHGNIHEDKKNPISRYMSTMGLFVMLRTRGHTHGHVQHWTNNHALQLLKDAGFNSAKQVETPFYDFITLFVSDNNNN